MGVCPWLQVEMSLRGSHLNSQPDVIQVRGTFTKLAEFFVELHSSSKKLGEGGRAWRICSPRHRVPFDSRVEGSMCVEFQGMTGIGRHVTGCHMTQQSTVQSAFDIRTWRVLLATS
jgi:hypothetical protein